MTARRCFTAKLRAGRISGRAGRQILDMLDAFEEMHRGTLGDDGGARAAALEAAEIAKSEAGRRADEVRRSIIAQANTLRAVVDYNERVAGLRGSPGDLFGIGNKAPPGLGKDEQTTLGFAVRSLFARDPWEIATWNNVNALAQT